MKKNESKTDIQAGIVGIAAVFTFIPTYKATDSLLLSLFIAFVAIIVTAILLVSISSGATSKVKDSESDAPDLAEMLAKIPNEASVWVPDRIKHVTQRVSVVYHLDCMVRGVSYQNKDRSDRQRLIEHYCSTNMILELVREPKNEFGASAIAVKVGGKQIGYIPTEHSVRIMEYIDNPAYAGTAIIYEIYGGTKNKPHYGVAIDVLVVKTGDTDNRPNVNGTPVKDIIEANPDNLKMMVECCKAEVTAFKARPAGCGLMPNHAPFTRAAILARKAKNHTAELAVCKLWLSLSKDYDTQQLVIDGKWKPVRTTAYHKKIVERMRRALELTAVQKY